MLAALMRIITSPLPWLASIFLVPLLACTGGEGTTCFQDDECNGSLICCHVGSPFTQGSCETEITCDELRGGGGTGGSGGTAGAGGAAGAGGTAGAGGAAGAGGTAGAGGAAGAGGTAGAGGAAGMAGQGGTGGA